MGSINLPNSIALLRADDVTSVNQCQFPRFMPNFHHRFQTASTLTSKPRRLVSCNIPPAAGTGVGNSSPARAGTHTVGEFMTRKEHLQVVKPSTTVDEALDLLVEKKVTGFPVVDDDWNLLGVVSDYDLLALDSISGCSLGDINIFPSVDSTWKTFKELQKLIGKTNGRIIGDLMTTTPLVVRETTKLEAAARLLLDTKYRRLPVVDAKGKLVGVFTRGNVVRAAVEMKRENQNST